VVKTVVGLVQILLEVCVRGLELSTRALRRQRKREPFRRGAVLLRS